MSLVEMGLRIVRINDLHVGVWLHSTVDPTMEHWQTAADLIRSHRAQYAVDAAHFRMFVLTDGGGPNVKQRQILNRPEIVQNVLTVALSNALTNPLKRGLVKAITWVNPAFRAMPPNEWEAGLAHLKMPVAAINDILAELALLQNEVMPVATLPSLRNEVGKRLSGVTA